MKVVKEEKPEELHKLIVRAPDGTETEVTSVCVTGPDGMAVQWNPAAAMFDEERGMLAYPFDAQALSRMRFWVAWWDNSLHGQHLKEV